MTSEENFLDMIKQNIGGRADALPTLVTGVVQGVGDNNCTVELMDGFVLSDVRWKATLDYDKGLAIVPKAGTNVIVAFTGNDKNTPYLLGMDEVDYLSLTIGNESLRFDKEGVDVSLDSGKVKVANSAADLKGILEDILEAVKTLTVSTGVGPSGTPLPPTITKVEALGKSIDSLFK